MEALREGDINKLIITVPGWNIIDGKLVLDIELKDFTTAIQATVAVAREAEAEDHHPDILVYGFNKFKLTLYTRSVNGLTEKDFKMAAKFTEALKSA